MVKVEGKTLLKKVPNSNSKTVVSQRGDSLGLHCYNSLAILGHPLFESALPLLCIILNANQRTKKKKGEILGMKLVHVHWQNDLKTICIC